MRKKLKRVIAVALSAIMIGGVVPVGNQMPQEVKAINPGYSGPYTGEANGIEWQYYAYKPYSSEITTAALIKPLDKTALNVTNIKIPTTLDGYTVTSIGDVAFSETNIVSVSFPASITNIGSSAFSDCKQLKTVNFQSETLPYLSYGAFKNCEAITEIECSEANSSSVFEGCKNLKKVTIHKSKYINSILIGSSMFKDCFSLEELELKGLEENEEIYIWEQAFENTALKELNFPNKVTIFENAFRYCMDLKNVVFQKDAVIKDSAFSTSLPDEGIDKKVVFYGKAEVGKNAFDGCSGINTLQFHDTAVVGTRAFKNCINIKKLNFPEDAELHYSSFEGCTGLEEVAFQRNADIQSPVWGNVEGPFYNCSKLKKIEFYGEKMSGPIDKLESLEEVIFHNNTVSIESQLKSLPNLKNIVFWAHNPEIKITNYVENNFNIVGYRDINYTSQKNRDTIYNWADSIGKVGCFRNIVTSLEAEYEGEVVEGTIPDESKITVNAFYYNDPLTPVKIEKAKDGNDLSGYTLQIGEVVKLGNNYFTTTFSSLQVNGRFTGIKRAISDLAVTSEAITLVEGDKITNDMITAEAIYNDGTREAVSSSAITIENDTIEVGKNTIYVSYEGVRGSFEVTGIEKKVEDVKAVYDGYIYETGELDKKKITVTNYYNNKTSEVVADYILSEIDNLELTEEDFQNLKVDTESNLRYVVKTVKVTSQDISTTMEVKVVPKEVVKLVATYNNEEVVEGCKINSEAVKLLAYYNDNPEKGMEVEVTEDMFSKYMIQVGQNSGITISYHGVVSNAFTVTGIAKRVTDVTMQYIGNEGNKVTEGTKLDVACVEITETYNDRTENIVRGTTETTTFGTYEIVVGSNQIVVNYQVEQKDGTKDTFQKKIEVEGIATIMTEMKAVYNGTVVVGEEIVKEKVILLGTYSNGIKDEPFTGAFTTEGKVLQVGKNTIKVYYYDVATGKNFSYDMEVEGVAAGGQTTKAPTATPDTSQEPEVTAPPNTSKEPEVTETPNASQKPEVTETPNASQKPEVTNTPSASQKPEVTNTPSASQKPDTTETPKTTSKPSPSNQPKATAAPSTNNNASTIFELKCSLRTIKLVDSSKINTYKIVTNKKLTFNLTIKNTNNVKYQIVQKGKKINAKGWKNVKNNKVTINKNVKNSVLYLQYVNQSGKVCTVKTKGFMLDKTAPIIKGVKNNKTYKKSVTIKCSDTLSGIRQVKLNGKAVKKEIKIIKFGNYNLQVTDKAGNKKTIKFKIQK